jgi:hypothetical protein
MKKLTEERKAIVEAAIVSGKASFQAYKAKGLNTFTEEGRTLIKGYLLNLDSGHFERVYD